MPNLIIKPSFLGKFFGRYRQLKIHSEGIVLYPRTGGDETILFFEFVDFPIVTTGLFGARLGFKTSRKTHLITLLNKFQTQSVTDQIESLVTSSLNKTIAQSRKVFRKYAIDEYLRDSSIEKVKSEVMPIFDSYRESTGNWREKLETSNIQFLDSLEKFIPLEKCSESLREEYEHRILSNRRQFYDTIESNPLTNSQRLAVIRDNDRNLVLAAAGTGKTSVIVAKAIDLIDSGSAKIDEILVLAYNNAAAKELKERVINKGKGFGISKEYGPSVYTFHALGRLILKEAKISTYLSEFAEDPIKLDMWISEWLVNYVQSSEKSLKNLIRLSYQPINPFDFQKKQEYDAYVRDNEYRTLQGERVKGYQELLIANWLYMNGVDYEYESPYVSKRRIEIGFDYRPDFHIKDTNIYLEHFGVDRAGNTRPDIDKVQYNLDMQSKRDLHSECDTILVETFHYDWTEGNLEKRLNCILHSVDIATHERTQDEIFDSLKKLGFLEESAERYLKCLQAIRVEQLDEASVLLRLQQNKIVYAEQYTELLVSIHDDYILELVEQKRIDFDDMIIRASQTVDEGKFVPKWTHILVDEFQDISMARMNFLRTLIDKGPNPRLTVVGDDWQSIYRFAGGKLELTTQFNEMVGSHSRTTLEKTFRYNSSIANIAGTFVMKNPEQYKKQVTTEDQVDSPQVFLLDSKVGNKNNLEERTIQVINTIRNNDKVGSIAILARYRYLLTNAKKTVNQHSISTNNIKYWTFHGSKGLEADYCILIGFFQGKSGFPNMNKEEAVVESLLPSLDSYPHSEERRLLYVALTRARKKSYMIADPMASSEFINELLSPRYELHIVSDTFEEAYRRIFKCPVCTEGYFRIIDGKHGNFYSCTSGSICNSKPRMCKECGSPSIDTKDKSTCNNANCRTEIMICERCGRPMKLRKGMFGQFWGCSGYGIPHDQCTHKRKYFG